MSTNKKNPKNKKNNKNTKNKNDVQYKNIYIGLSSEDDKKQNHHKTTMKMLWKARKLRFWNTGAI